MRKGERQKEGGQERASNEEHATSRASLAISQSLTMDASSDTESKIRADAKEKIKSFKENADRLLSVFKTQQDISKMYFEEQHRKHSLGLEKDRLKGLLDKLRKELEKTQVAFAQLEQAEKERHDLMKKELDGKKDCIPPLEEKVAQLEAANRKLADEESSDTKTLSDFETEKGVMQQKLKLLKEDKFKSFLSSAKEKAAAIKTYSTELSKVKQTIDEYARRHEWARNRLEKFEETSKYIGLSVPGERENDIQMDVDAETVAQLEMRLSDLKRQLEFVSTLSVFQFYFSPDRLLLIYLSCRKNWTSKAAVWLRRCWIDSESILLSCLIV